jgi:hypothetical protein
LVAKFEKLVGGVKKAFGTKKKILLNQMYYEQEKERKFMNGGGKIDD